MYIKLEKGTPPLPHVREAGSAARQNEQNRGEFRERGSTYEVCSQLSDGGDDDAAPLNKNTYGSAKGGATPKAH